MKRKISIGFSRPSKFKIGSYLIRLWQGGTSFSHVYLKCDASSISRTIVYQAGHGDIHAIEYSNFTEDNIVCHEFELDVEESQYVKALQAAVDLLQRPYGFLGLALLVLVKGMGLKSKGDGTRTLHCSEFIVYPFPELLPYIGERDPDFMEPVDIYNALLKCPFIKSMRAYERR